MLRQNGATHDSKLPAPYEPQPAMIAPRRVRVIMNTSAGQKAGVSTNGMTVEQVGDLMARHGLGDELVPTESEADAIAAVREAVALGYDVVVAAGGDGTAGLVATELLGSSTALGILPLGSVMNIGRMLDISRDPEQAAAIIATGEARAIDVGRANGRLFFECGSVGLNAAIFREAQRVDDRDYRSALSAVLALVRYRPARMVIHLDDRVMTTRALMVTVANGPYTGIGFTVAPSARLDDGRFDVRVFRRFRRIGLVAYLATIAFGRRKYSPKISTYRSSTVRIESRQPLPCRADAHDLGTTPVTYSVLPGALRVIVPSFSPR
jgi:diacylglycerol kinase (ATP)